MPKTTPRAALDAEIEAAWQAGIMHCLVWHCGMDSAKASKLAGEIAQRPSTLAARKRAAADRVMGAILATVVDERATRQGALW